VKRVCTHCERVSPEGNLWCENRDCPSGTMTLIFDYGDSLGDIEVIRLMRILRTSAIYEAKRGSETILLKVAHDNCQDQLRREATTLAQFGEKQQHPMLPKLLPAYQYADLKQRPYGKTVVQEETKYYVVFKHIEGEFLRDMLAKNPQPWYQHAAWLAVSLSDVLAFLHVKAGKFHLNLNPSCILVRIDKSGVPRPVLVDLGICSAEINRDQVLRSCLPAYTAPELLDKNITVSPTTDVYGLGLVLYEMLSGRPAYKYRLRSDDEIRQSVRKENPPPVNRTDLAEEVAAVVHQAIDRSPARRHPDVRSFAKALRTKFGEVPPEPKGIQVGPRVVALAVASTLIVIVWTVIAALVESSFGR
jgi:serine/threonine protein kinase